MASARVQNWALTLSAYDYKVQYVPGKENPVADVFSRLPLPVQPKQIPMPEELVLLVESLEISTVTVAQIKCWTEHDPGAQVCTAGLAQISQPRASTLLHQKIGA